MIDPFQARQMQATVTRDATTRTTADGLSITAFMAAPDDAKANRSVHIIADGEYAQKLESLKVGDRVSIQGEMKVLEPTKTVALKVTDVLSIDRVMQHRQEDSLSY